MIEYRSVVSDSHLCKALRRAMVFQLLSLDHSSQHVHCSDSVAISHGGACASREKRAFTIAEVGRSLAILYIEGF